jgi:hypothetical protein
MDPLDSVFQRFKSVVHFLNNQYQMGTITEPEYRARTTETMESFIKIIKENLFVAK